MVSTLALQVGAIIAGKAPSWWHWQGRRVCLVDGTTVTLADTEKNQEAYPQPSSQKPGLGFAQCRVVGLFCLGSSALLNAATAPCEGKGSDEQTLYFRSYSRCENRRIAGYVTVFITQKTGEKTSERVYFSP
jgi:hypothetical protein